MNEYKLAKIVLRKFIVDHMGLTGNQVFRAPPFPTEIGVYPAIIIRSATSQKTVSQGDGISYNRYNLLLGILTRSATAQDASDELDDLLKLLDNEIATHGEKGLDTSGLTDSRWFEFTRLEMQTTFDNAIQDDVGWVVYGATAGVSIVEAMPEVAG